MLTLTIPEPLVHEDSATLLWSRQPRGTATVLVNGALYARTDKYHLTLKDLTPDTLYDVTVEVGGTAVNATFRTKKALCRIDVTQPPYCAVGDGKTLSTAAIQKALDDCTAADAVVIPAGTFLTGALNIHSNTTLLVEKGAVLLGSGDQMDYQPKVPSRFEGWEMNCYRSLLNLGTLDREGFTCENVVIRGEGIIRGGGQPLMDSEIRAEMFITGETDRVLAARCRGRLIAVNSCRNVVIAGLNLQDGPAWNVHMIYSKGVYTHDCCFRSIGLWNGDGWDPDSSEDCTCFGCLFDTGDDAIAIKSGKNPEGNIIGRPTRNVRIFDCRCLGGHGITIGSEMSGGVEHVDIADCDLRASVYGIEIKGTQKRGGYVRDVNVTNCDVSRLLLHSVGYNDDGEGAPEPPIFRDMTFREVRASGQVLHNHALEEVEFALEACGFEGAPLQNILFDGVTLGHEGCISKRILIKNEGDTSFGGVLLMNGAAPAIHRA